MSDKKVDPNDAPEGFEACSSSGGRGKSCAGCHFAACIPCPERDDGTAWCSERNREDGQSVIFVKKEKQMSDKKVNPDDAPEGFKACLSSGGGTRSCTGCCFYSSDDGCSNTKASLMCCANSRDDGQKVIFVKKTTTPVQSEPASAKTPMHEWKERFHHAHDISCHYAHDTTSYFCISVCGTGYDISIRYNKDDMDVLIDQLKIVLREAELYREVSKGVK